MKCKHERELKVLIDAAWREFVDQHPPVKNESNVAYDTRLKAGFTKELKKRGVSVTN